MAQDPIQIPPRARNRWLWSLFVLGLVGILILLPAAARVDAIGHRRKHATSMHLEIQSAAHLQHRVAERLPLRRGRADGEFNRPPRRELPLIQLDPDARLLGLVFLRQPAKSAGLHRY